MMLRALSLPTFGQTHWHVWARARVPDVTTAEVLVSEESSPANALWSLERKMEFEVFLLLQTVDMTTWSGNSTAVCKVNCNNTGKVHSHREHKTKVLTKKTTLFWRSQKGCHAQ